MKHMSFGTLMDVLDWFDDSLYDYVHHILLAKLDGEERIRRALPLLHRHAEELIASHRGTECAYPEEPVSLSA